MSARKLHLIAPTGGSADHSLASDAAAAAWLVRHDVSPATSSDPAFLTWLESSDDHRRAWVQAQDLWGQAEQVPANDPLMPTLRAQALSARPPTFMRPQAIAACAAAAVVVAGLGGAAAWRLTGQAPTPTSVVASTTASATPETQHLANTKTAPLSVRLADGSQLQLDADSAVDVSYTRAHRQLRLTRGQAFVTVAADPARQFTFEAAGQTIIDRGTAFGVRLTGQQVAVTLVEGAVSVGPTGAIKPLELVPGQRLTISPDRPARIETVNTGQFLAWRDGYVEFSDTPLGEAAAEMNRYGGPRLIVRDPAVAHLKTSGRFKLGDSARFARAASALLPVHVANVPAGLELRAGASSATPTL